MSGEKRQREADPCSICLNSPMLKPIYQCENGHVLCSSCEARLLECPTCKLTLPKRRKIRNIALEHWQAPLIRCKNDGCPTEHVSTEDMELHVQKECSFVKRNLCKSIGIDLNCEMEFKPADAEAAYTHLLRAHADAKAKPFNYNSPGVWLGPAKRFRCFTHKGKLFVIKSEIQRTKNYGKTRYLTPFVFAAASQAKDVNMTIKLWIGEETSSQEVSRAEFMGKASTQHVTATGALVPIIDYDPSVPSPLIITAGEIRNSCYMQVSL